MWCWYKARKIRNRYVRFTEIENYYQILAELSEDTTISKYASNLVFLTSANFPSEIENKIIYSIIHKQPKRADIYWLVHVDVMDVPYGREYKVQTFIPNHRSEEHTSELQSLMRISYSVFCLKKK